MPLSIPTVQDRLLGRLCQEFDNSEDSIRHLVELLEAGKRIPSFFVPRDPRLSHMTAARMYEIRERVSDLRMLEEHKTVVLETAERQGWGSGPALVERVLGFTHIDHLEDYFQTLRQRFKGPSAEARERGLGVFADALRDRTLAEGESPLDAAARFVDPEKGIADAKTALDGAKTILLHEIEAPKRLIDAVREAPVRARSKSGKSLPKGYESLAKLNKPAHSVGWEDFLLLRRAEREGLVDVEFGLSEEKAHQLLAETYTAGLESTHPLRSFWDSVLREAWLDLLKAPIERDVLRDVKQRADRDAIRSFARRYEELLMAAPVGARRVCGVLPAIRKATRLAVVDGDGAPVANMGCHPAVADKRADSMQRVQAFVTEHHVEVLALGAGPGCREVEGFLLEAIQSLDTRPQLITVDESGLLAIAKRGQSKLDLGARKATMLARRAQNPISEWARVDPGLLPLGPTMSEVRPNQLARALEDIREVCLHQIGVDAGTEPEDVLALVVGLDREKAKKIVAARKAPSGLANLNALVEGGALEAAALEAAAPFLRYAKSTEALDQTRLRPSQYRIVEEIAASLGLSSAQLLADPTQIDRAKLDAFVRDDLDRQALDDIVATMREPLDDPRPTFEMAHFAPGVKSIDDLHMGIEIEGRITRIASFGAFVDVGVAPGGLLHVSQLADRYVNDPTTLVHPGQVVRVRVLEVDKAKGRVSLTMRSGDIQKIPRTLGDMASGKRRPGAVVVRQGRGQQREEKTEIRSRAATRPGRGGRPGERGQGGRGQGGRGRGGPGRDRSDRGDRGGFRGMRGPITVESADIEAAAQADRGHKGELKSFAALAGLASGASSQANQPSDAAPKKKKAAPQKAPEPKPAEPTPEPNQPDEPQSPAPADTTTKPDEPKQPFGEDFV